MIADGLPDPAPAGDAQARAYIYTRDVDQPFRVKVAELDGLRLAADDEPAADAYAPQWVPPTTDLYVLLQLWSGARPLGPSASTERCKSANVATGRYRWDQWVEFPLLYCDIPLDTLLCYTIWSSSSPVPVGGTTTHVFSTRGVLKRGPRRLRLHEGVEASGLDVTATPGKIESKSFLHRAERVRRNAEQIRWLDVLSNKTFAELTEKAHSAAAKAAAAASPAEDALVTVVVEYPTFKLPVHHTALPGGMKDIPGPQTSTGLVTVRDPEVQTGLDTNPCESKAARMMKTLHAVGALSRRPNEKEYRRIKAILKEGPFAPPSADDGDLLWRFRHYLKENEIGFTKFMRSVDWNDEREVAMATKLIAGWGGLTLQDCLECLSGPFRGLHAVREHAVERLSRESDQTLVDILLQLVQALRYERDALNCPLLKLLCERSLNMELCSYLYWYATVETTVKVETEAQQLVVNTYKDVIEKLLESVPLVIRNRVLKQRDFMKMLGDIQKECSSSKKSSSKTQRAKELVKEGRCGIVQLFERGRAPQEVSNKSGLFAAAKQKLMQATSATAPPQRQSSHGVEEEEDESTVETAKVTSPLFPTIELTGCKSEGIYVFTSAKTPMAIPFTSAEPGKDLRLMYKAGDDIRQDQLVLQLIAMMDKLLTQDGLDLKITPYRVLATSADDGLLEMVGKVEQLQSILQDIRKYLRQHNHDRNGEFELTKECLDNWVRSNAGYAIITFILGIGDRHLENLLVTSDGRLLHIDFGFILGRDPKPLPPPLKLRKQMVDAMGGLDSSHFREFKKLCCSAFNIIRKHSALIINAMAMMVDANIPDLNADVRTTKDPYQRIRLVEEKLRLDLNDEEATVYFLRIIDEAINSIFGKIGDWVHQKAAGMRA